MKNRKIRGRADATPPAASTGTPAFFRTADLIARWGVSRTTLWAWERDGLLPRGVRLGPNVKLWPARAIEAFERSRVAANGATA
jgi:predicted DNA-binding transcriptional regulator AlpA